MTKKHILHIVSKLPEKYNSKFVQFSQDNFTEQQHTYVALTSAHGNNQGQSDNSSNIVYLSKFNRFDKIRKLISLLLSKEYDLVIFHGLFYQGPLLALLAIIFKLSTLEQKSLWMTWGGDIYYFQNRPDSIMGWLNERLRKSIIKKFFFISSLIPDEVELIKINYKSQAVHLDAFYPNPTSYQKDHVAVPTERSEVDKFSFLLGNSAAPQNNHLEMLTSLSHLKGSIKIYCILSYAIVDTEYVERVKELGSDLFADDFVALTEFMKPEEYQSFINEIDFACYYHNRQQAMGNVFQFLFMGKSVFLRQDTLSCMFLQEHGLTVQDTDSLGTITLDDLSLLKQKSIENIALSQAVIQDNFSEVAANKKWQFMFKRIFALLKKSR